MNNNDQVKAYAALCAPLVAKRREDAREAAEKLKRAQADPDPHRCVVTLSRKSRELQRFGMRRLARVKRPLRTKATHFA